MRHSQSFGGVSNGDHPWRADAGGVSAQLRQQKKGKISESGLTKRITGGGEATETGEDVTRSVRSHHDPVKSRVPKGQARSMTIVPYENLGTTEGDGVGAGLKFTGRDRTESEATRGELPRGLGGKRGR